MQSNGFVLIRSNENFTIILLDDFVVFTFDSTIPFDRNVIKNRGTLKNDELTSNEITLLGILLSNPSISLVDARDKMGISRRTISRIVSSLKDKGIVERHGSKKQGSCKIVK